MEFLLILPVQVLLVVLFHLVGFCFVLILLCMPLPKHLIAFQVVNLINTEQGDISQ